MINKEQYFSISKLIAKQISNSITDDEQKYLTEWIETSQENKNIYQAIKQEDWYKSNLEDMQQFNIEKGWNQIMSKVKIQPKAIKLTPRIYRYVAAAVLVVALTSVYFLRHQIFNGTIEQTTPIIVNNQIEPGTDKATLTLETGEIVALEKGTAYQTQNATSNGEEITYNSRNNTSRELVYNYLTIPRGGQFQMTLSDGTRVWLNSETQLKYPVSFTDGESRQVELVYGEAYFDVSPSTEHKGSDFRVFNNNQEVRVLGTEFNIKVYKDETYIYTTLVEGKIAVDYSNNTQLLNPGEQSSLDSKTNMLAINNVDVNIETAWREGNFNFIQGKSLKEIMKVLSRWYDFDIVFENKSLEEVRFKGILGKNQNVEEILSAIKSTSINNYEINNKTIILK